MLHTAIGNIEVVVAKILTIIFIRTLLLNMFLVDHFCVFLTSVNLRMLDDDLGVACKAASPQMDWQRLPFVIEAREWLYSAVKLANISKSNLLSLPGAWKGNPPVYGSFPK